MGEGDFTAEERADTIAQSIPLLWRYIYTVKPIRWLLIPNILAALIGTLGYFAILWIAGKLVECGRAEVCEGVIPLLDIKVYISLGLLIWVACLVVVGRAIQWIAFESGGQVASLPLFRSMIQGLSRVRTTFFDEYPSGKIINRIVGDFEMLRLLGPIRVGDSLNSLMELLVAAALVSFANPWAALVALPVLGFFLLVQRNVAPMLQRVTTLRSARFGEVLHRGTDIIEGARTYVIYGQPRVALRRLCSAVLRYMQMHFLRGRVEMWGRFWSEIVVALYTALALFGVFLALHGGALSVVTAMVIVTALFRLSVNFGWLTWSFGYLFETAGHARRVFEYADLKDEVSEERKAPLVKTRSGERSVPSGGDLVFSNYSMSYRVGSPIVLSNISLIIAQGSKVGLVGRTGAGKSSLVQALYRMVYVHIGDISIGGQSLFSLPIAEARRTFAIVPQDPYLFEGTVRSNLDRYGEYSELLLKDALDAASFPFALNTPLHEGGANLSLGERQLLCLARVILTQRPVVVMDEPTSGVDSITDSTIQSVLRERLKDRTVITIAHRLETLERVERIIELRDGEVADDGPVRKILPRLAKDDVQ